MLRTIQATRMLMIVVCLRKRICELDQTATATVVTKRREKNHKQNFEQTNKQTKR